MEYFPIVNEQGEVLGRATRQECHSGQTPEERERLLHPVVHLHVFSSRGELYLQRRSWQKDLLPGYWDTAVGGHVDYGETIEEALRREVQEEIGLENYQAEHWLTYRYDSQRESEMVHVYRTQSDGPFHWNDGEVIDGRFWSLQELREAMGKGVLTPNLEMELQKFGIVPSERAERVLNYLDAQDIRYEVYHHPEGRTIEEAKRWWRQDGSVHCKNIFLRNHKGNQHYLVCFDCDHDLDIHDLEQRLKAELMAQGLNSPGKLSFASPERMMKYLGLEPGSVSPFGLINDEEHHVILFLDEQLQQAGSLSFHPNDCRGTVVISREEFERYLEGVGNRYRFMKLYE